MHIDISPILSITIIIILISQTLVDRVSNMLFAARRFVARAPAALRVAPTPINSASRLFTSSALRFAAGPPVIQGDGAKDGEMPTDEQQATGLERFELLGKLKGVDVFDMEPLQMTHLGTTENRIKVQSFVSIRHDNSQPTHSQHLYDSEVTLQHAV